MNYSIWISCAEIFSERIYDLLAAPSVPPVRSINSTDPKRPQLFLTTDNATHQKYIQDLREVNVRTLEEAMTVLRAGYRQRQLYAALTNKPSPRSHCIVTIKVLKTPQFGESAMKDAAKGKTSISRLSIVDLAGSELLRTATSNAGHEVKDLGNGDTSLVVLGHCLKVLRANHTTNSKVIQWTFHFYYLIISNTRHSSLPFSCLAFSPFLHIEPSGSSISSEQTDATLSRITAGQPGSLTGAPNCQHQPLSIQV
jgi:hypothetical protein